MTIDEAIARLQQLNEGWPLGNKEPYFAALKLGIEALRRVEDMRIAPCTTADEMLPGETP